VKSETISGCQEQIQGGKKKQKATNIRVPKADKLRRKQTGRNKGTGLDLHNKEYAGPGKERPRQIMENSYGGRKQPESPKKYSDDHSKKLANSGWRKKMGST